MNIATLSGLQSTWEDDLEPSFQCLNRSTFQCRFPPAESCTILLLLILPEPVVDQVAAALQNYLLYTCALTLAHLSLQKFSNNKLFTTTALQISM